MPFYDYRCAKCGATVEILHGIDEQVERSHDACGGPLERQFSAASVHFKGSGWAKLDRRSGGSVPSDAPASAPAPSPKSDAK